jgi:protein gp37
VDEPFKVVCDSTKLDYPGKLKKPRLIFVSSMGDLFHRDVPDRFIWDVFDTIYLQNHHRYVILTKRPERMREVLEAYVGDEDIKCMDEFFPHVVFGVSVENQETAESRIPVLLKINCRFRAISAEPLLSEIEFKPEWIFPYGCQKCNYTFRAEGVIDTPYGGG